MGMRGVCSAFCLDGVVDFILQYFFGIDIIYCNDKSVKWKCSKFDILDV